ncbi:hypothetical protein ABW19_dt0208563 [Dactylella cylindrospora]|nr:hypothetical protein ABW19_dt0208563 [Dactylella cylindrospora]
MATVDPTAQVGGGVATVIQAYTPIKITSESLLNELKTIYKIASHQAEASSHRSLFHHSKSSTAETKDSALHPADFKAFIEQTQHDTLPTDGEVAALLNKDGDISFAEFTKYFTGQESNLIAPPPPSDLDHPLTSYFISSSHNTYLVGHQLYGTSTAQGYINVLNRACRCIEIDVWDGDDGEPEVVHGWTLTKEISFKDVCIAIAQHAFVSSNLPLIVSLECHAGMEQQEKMVRIMKDVWKGLLLEGDLEGWDTAAKGLPPPRLLLRKILVKTIFKKVKYLPPDAQPGGPQNIGIQSLTDQTKKLSVSPTPGKKPAEPEDTSSEEDGRSGSEPDASGKKKPKVKISAALSALGVYASAMKFADSFTDAVSTRPNHVFSFSESKFNSLHEAHADALFQHNRHYLTRVYPFGLRVSSGNLNPQDFWRRGAQLVALNWQKVDTGMMFNEAMFAGTGGFVLKPESHLPNLVSAKAFKDLERNIDLHITVLAAQALPVPEGDNPKSFEPYVKVSVHVSEEVKQKHGTKPNGKGVDVAWGEKKGALSFKGLKAVVQELAFVKFKVFDDEFGRDDLAAWACVRLDRLKSGYRTLKLFDTKGADTSGVLLVKVEKTIK